MKQIKFLDSKETRKIKKIILDCFGVCAEFGGYAFVLDSKEKLYLITRDIEKLDLNKFRVNNIGMYFGKYEKGSLRLSIEGSQFIKPVKNVIELNGKQISEWMKGTDVDAETDLKGIVAVKHGDDFYGCGKAGEGVLYNFVSKSRRLAVVND